MGDSFMTTMPKKNRHGTVVYSQAEVRNVYETLYYLLISYVYFIWVIVHS